jgi:uncharacterized protein YwgA
MKLEFLILTILDLIGDNERGRTLLQKIIYFYSVLLKEDFGYQPHYYGPYSTTVDNTIKNLKSLGYLNESVDTWGIDNRGFEKKKYKYSLSGDGAYLLDYLSKDNLKVREEIGKIFFKLKENIDLTDTNSLSIAAKTFHIISHNSSSEIDEKAIKEEAKNIGWNVKEDEIVEATNFLVGMKLINN